MNKLFQASVINIMFIISIQASSLAELPEIKYESFKLDNGLTVIVHEDKKVPMVAVNVWYHVGSKNEKLGKTGLLIYSNISCLMELRTTTMNILNHLKK